MEHPIPVTRGIRGILHLRHGDAEIVYRGTYTPDPLQMDLFRSQVTFKSKQLHATLDCSRLRWSVREGRVHTIVGYYECPPLPIHRS